MDKIFKGYCPKFNDEFSISIHYIESKHPTDTNRKFRKGLANCDRRERYGDENCENCQIANSAPTFL